MVRGRGRRHGNNGGSRATPYERLRVGRGRRREGGGELKGRVKGGSGGRRGSVKPKSKTAEELDAEMDSYWGKSEEHAAKKLDSDMDDYWKNKEDKPQEDDDKKKDNIDDEKEKETVTNKMEDEVVAQEPASITMEFAKE
ncbi:unnamed protein product [Peronospora belbahrii]|uniref:Chromatin target of PRMT1 protein C-terminal domain-containing protein n=1 Tax=Peronospora belbahrii TaxID=622444 RepID=A0AAU9KY30_9STRA|nr:unnamed protein product [Peronospora belbahrii]CAH0516087.1 unnamed protein product [Peronospora belbahrii]